MEKNQTGKSLGAVASDAKRNENPPIAELAWLFSEWHPKKNGHLDPYSLSSGTTKKIWWLCKEGHEFQYPGVIRLKGTSCQVCASLGFKHASLIEYWDYERNGFSPYEISAGSGKKTHWICPSGHQIFRTTGKVVDRGICCTLLPNGKIRPSRALVKGENDFATVQPKLAEEWSPHQKQQPSDFLPNSGHKASWICSRQGHEYEMEITKRTSGQDCPDCRIGRVEFGISDLETKRPEIAAQWHPTKNGLMMPSRVSDQAAKKFWWLCKEGHEWPQSPNARRSTNCPICINQRFLVGFNDLQTWDPNLAQQWDSVKNGETTAEMVFFGSLTGRWWVCQRNARHSWKAAPATRRKGHGCPYCAGVKALQGETDIATTNPELADQIDRDFHSEKEIAELAAGTGRRIHWVCGEFANHKYTSNGAKRLAGNGCPYCSGHQVLEGFNDLQTKSPSLATEWDSTRNGLLTPKSVTVASQKKIWWVCSKDSTHNWRATPSTRQWSGCPGCSPSGFNPTLPAILYYLEHPDLMASKVGITAAGSSRVHIFSRAGWVQIRTWEFDVGLHALDVETLFFRWLRKDMGMPPYLSKAEMPNTGGNSETFALDRFSREEVMKKIEDLIAIV
jgi:hypothetical protein